MADTVMSMGRIRMLVGPMCLAQILGMFGYNLWPAMILDFQERWNLSSTAAGWIGGAYFFGYVAAIWPLSNLTDRVDPKKIYLLSMVLTVIAPLGFASTAGGFWTAALWRCLQGVGLAGTYMPGLKLLTDVVPESVRSRTVAWYTAIFYVGAALSLYFGTNLNGLMDWRWIWMFSASGPAIALLMVWLILPAAPPNIADLPTSGLLDLRPALTNRKVMGFTMAYSAHSAELMGFYTWIVAFLTFSQGMQHPGTPGTSLGIGAIASTVTLLAVPASLLGNEAAGRFGRLRVLRIVMFGSAVVAAALGFSATLSFPVVLGLLLLYGISVAADSATITAGVVDVAEPRYRGTVMAAYSLIGFIGASMGPVVFGFLLDLGGGETSSLGWGLGFMSLSFMVMLGPIAVAYGLRRD